MAEQWNDPVDRLLEKVTAEHDARLAAGTAPQTLFVLVFKYVHYDQEKVHVIGVFETREQAEAVVEKIMSRAGKFIAFLDLWTSRLWREDFIIEECELGNAAAATTAGVWVKNWVLHGDDSGYHYFCRKECGNEHRKKQKPLDDLVNRLKTERPWCYDEAGQQFVYVPQELGEAAAASIERLREALRQVSKDMHCVSSRPCPTCRNVTAAFGEPFGCEVR